MLHFREDENTSFLQNKLPFVTMGVVLFYLIILARLFYLQVSQGEKYLTLATKTFVREEEIIARRGNILDRFGKKLADTRPYYEVSITPQYLDKKERILQNLAELFDVPIQEIEEKLSKARYEPRFRPVSILEDISYDGAVKLRQRLGPDYFEESPYYLNGVSLQVTPLRRYLYPEVFSHALGYLREIDKKGLERMADKHPGRYTRGDLLGAAGVEYAYDLELRGHDGQLGRVVDARGREVAKIEDVRILKERATLEPQAGYHLLTTLDFDAQTAAHEAMQGRKGAVVALDPNNGEVIVMYSSPGYDANRITKNVDKEYWKKINLDEDKYLFNRTLQGTYPPASTYKAMAIVAGIEEGVVDPHKTTYYCGGGIQFGNRYFKCWTSHGRVNALSALGRSCDVFFYQVGIKLGVDRLAKYAKLMGYGHKTGIEIPYEQSGLVPSREWKQKRFKQEWIESETLSVSIGQSYNLVTMLQNAKMASIVANGGYEVTPHLGRAILNTDGSVHRKIRYPKKETGLINSEGLAWAKKGMIEVVHGYGTAVRLRNSPFQIAGKTGTAQVIGHDSKARRGRHTENHGLFISFAPYDDPKIAVAVIVENGRSGSGSAAPVAMQVIDAYLGKVLPDYGKDTTQTWYDPIN